MGVVYIDFTSEYIYIIVYCRYDTAAVVPRRVADTQPDTGISHTACKDELRQNLRPDSWRSVNLFSFPVL